jgi:hypothetical protein
MKQGDAVAVADGLSDARITGIQPVVECMVHGRVSFWQKHLFVFVLKLFLSAQTLFGVLTFIPLI